MPYTPIDEPDYQLQHTPRFSWETSCTEAVFIFDIVHCNLISLNKDTKIYPNCLHCLGTDSLIYVLRTFILSENKRQLVTAACFQLLVHCGSSFTPIAHRQNYSRSTANDVATCVNHRDRRFHVVIYRDGSFSS